MSKFTLIIVNNFTYVWSNYLETIFDKILYVVGNTDIRYNYNSYFQHPR